MSYSGSLILGPSTSTSPDFPTALAIVNRVLTECRVSPTATTLNPGTTNTNIVFEALNDAQQLIWRSERWDWRKRSAFIPMLADVYDYTLPSDFDEMLIPPMVGGVTPLEHMDPISFHTLWGFYDPAPTSGSPRSCVLLNNKLRIYPPPSADSLTAAPRIEMMYLRRPPPRLSVDQELDSWDLPTEFLSCMIALAKWTLKSALAYPDARVDLDRHNELLQYQIRRASKTQGPPKVRRAGPLIMSDQDY